MKHALPIVMASLAAASGLGGCALLHHLDARAHPPPPIVHSTAPGPGEEALLDEAMAARRLGDDDVALALFHDVLAENPMVTTAYMGIGEIYFDRAQYDRAEPAFARAARLEPRNSLAHFEHGLSLQMLHRALEAMRAYHRALTIDPDHPGANFGLGSVYLEMDEPDSALTFAERAVQLDPGSGRAYANLGAVYELLGRNEEAIDAYLAAVELMEPTPALLLNLVNVLARAKRYQEALNTAQSVVRLEPSADVYERMGWAHFRLRDTAGSLAAYRQAIDIDPQHWPSWNGIGVISLNKWIESDRRDLVAMADAREAFRQSLRVNSDQQKVISMMARYGLR